MKKIIKWIGWILSGIGGIIVSVFLFRSRKKEVTSSEIKFGKNDDKHLLSGVTGNDLIRKVERESNHRE